jgi:hypothetical protein
MAILEYKEVRRKPKTLLAMTSYKESEFEELLKHFVVAYEKRYPGKANKLGRPEVYLQEPEEKLFFICFIIRPTPCKKCWPISLA